MKIKLYFILLIIAITTLFYSCLKPPKQPITMIYLMGDSLTSSSYGDYTKHFKNLLLRKKIYFHKSVTLARPGNNTKEYLDFLKGSIISIKHKNKFKKAIFVLLLGTNDVRVDGDRLSLSQFTNNYKEIITIIRNNFKEVNIKIYLVTPPPIFNPDLYTFTKESSVRIENEIVPAVKKICMQMNAEPIDLHLFFKENPRLIPGIHPTKTGYFAMGRFIFNSIFKKEIN